MRRFVDTMKRCALVTMLVSSVGGSACTRDEPDRPGSTRVAAGTLVATAARQAGGEVIASLDTEAPAVRWIGDENILALMNLLNSRVKAAADWELQQWGSDTTRAFAAEMASEHSLIRYTLDSASSALGMVPVPPALSAEIDSLTRQQLSTLQVPGGRPLDRAYVNEQIAAHESMLDYLTKFAAAAEHQELRTVIDSINARLRVHLARARSLKTQFARADSAKAAADSARRARQRRP